MLYSKFRRCSPCGDGVIRRLYLERVGGNVGEKMAITVMIVVPALAVPVAAPVAAPVAVPLAVLVAVPKITLTERSAVAPSVIMVNLWMSPLF